MITINNNVLLRDYTTFKIGGPADFFVVVKNIDELKEAILWSKEKKQRVCILAGGSNLIFLDEGFRGLVIKPEFDKLNINGEKVEVGASVRLETLIQATLAQGLVGLEFAAGIPGTVGGAIRGNAGTFGEDMSDRVSKIVYLEPASMALRTCVGSECNFTYRHSMFKENNFFIVEAELLLTKGDTTASHDLITKRIKTRREQHPLEPSAGCIFKNIRFEDVDLEDLKNRGVEIDKFDNYKKIPVGYLIEQLDLKGKILGGAQISPKHGNYIINTGQATAENVITLISLMQQQVRDKYGIQLNLEVQIVYN